MRPCSGSKLCEAAEFGSRGSSCVSVCVCCVALFASRWSVRPIPEETFCVSSIVSYLLPDFLPPYIVSVVRSARLLVTYTFVFCFQCSVLSR